MSQKESHLPRNLSLTYQEASGRQGSLFYLPWIKKNSKEPSLCGLVVESRPTSMNQEVMVWNLVRAHAQVVSLFPVWSVQGGGGWKGSVAGGSQSVILSSMMFYLFLPPFLPKINTNILIHILKFNRIILSHLYVPSSFPSSLWFRIIEVRSLILITQTY